MSFPLVNLGDYLIDERSGASLKKDDFVESGVPVVPKKAISEDIRLLDETFCFTSDEKFNLCQRASIDRNHLVTTFRNLNPDGSTLCLICERSDDAEDIILAQGMHAFKTKDELHPRYLCHLSRHAEFRKQVQKIKVGSTQVHVRGKEFRQIKIPLPPLSEQRRIAAILDKADELGQKRRQAIEKLDQLLQSVFLDMFGDPVTNPKGWEVVQVGDVTDCIVPGRDKPKSFTGSIPWITTDDLVHLGETKASKKTMGLTDDEITNVRARVIPAGSVILSCVGDLGISSIAGVDMVVNQQLHTYQCGDRLDPVYLMCSLPYRKAYMVNRATSTTLPYMNKSVCNSIPITLPPVEMQKRFRMIYEAISREITSMEKAIFSFGNLFHSLQQRAFNGTL